MNSSGIKRKQARNFLGKAIALIQLALSAVLVAKLALNGIVPLKYIAVAALALILFFNVALGLQYVKGNLKYLGIFISLAVCAVALVGITGVSKIDFLMQEVSGKDYKTDNMVVAVRVDDPAESIEELIDADCPFAVQTMLDQKNNASFVEGLEKAYNAELEIKQYGSVAEAAEALLSREVDAAIYNKAFTRLIEDRIEDYSSRVRIIYEQEIKTELQVSKEVQNAGDPFNIYISGIDIDGPIDETSCSDVNIIMTVNPMSKKILLTTTPRDYYVEIPDVSMGMPDKLTHAGIYGVDASIRTLEALYDTDISYYARVNFTSVINIIDALGGVVVHSDYDFTVGECSFHKGDNWLSGYQALLFVRERESFFDGDNQRGRNQQELIKAVIKKTLSPEILIKANQIIASVSDSVQTDMPQSLITKFINMQLKEGTDWTIETSEVSGSYDNLPCFSLSAENVYAVTVPDEDSVNAAAYKIRMALEGN